MSCNETIIFPGWEKAPDHTATYWDRYSGKWYREASGMYCEAHPAGNGQWYRSIHKNSLLGNGRFMPRTTSTDTTRHIARPGVEQPETTNEVTFTMSAEESKAIALDKRPMQVVACVFSNESEAKEYHYFAPAEARAGQFAVVYAQGNIIQNRDFPFTVVKIVRDNVLDVAGKANKAILGTFDEGFAKHVQARMEHMARVKAQLQQKKKQFEENAIFEMLATQDPEAAALLAELKEFQV